MGTRREEGDQVDIRYVRADPHRARVVGEEAPSRGRLKSVAIGAPLCTALVFGLMMAVDQARHRLTS